MNALICEKIREGIRTCLNTSMKHLFFPASIRMVVAIGLTFSSSISGQIIDNWNVNAGGLQNYTTGSNWVNGMVPNGEGHISNITANISANQLVDLSGNIKLGVLNLGDISGNQTYTIQGGTIDFDNSLWGANPTGARAQLNKVVGGGDLISADLNLISNLMIYNRVGMTISGTIGGGGYFMKAGTSDLTLTGLNSGMLGDTIINTTGGTVFLNSVGGTAISSPVIRLGNSSTDGGSTVRLRLSQADQITDATMIRFDGASGREAFFQLNGFNETIAGIQDYTSRGVIENIGAANSTLTLDMGGIDSTYNGFIRNNGTGTLKVVKNGSGTLSLSGAEIRFTGGLDVNDGKVVLTNLRADDNNQNRFGSNILLNGVGTNLELGSTSNWILANVVSGSGSLTRSNGTTTVTLTADNTYTGATTINNGILQIGGIDPPGSAPVIGASARLSGTSSIFVNGVGTLAIVNRNDANHADRIRDAAPITLDGGNITFLNNGAGGAYAETLGAITLTSGKASIRAGRSGGSTDPTSSVLTLTSLTRQPTSTLDFANSGTGPVIGSGVQNQVLISGGVTLNDGIIGGWATAGNEWATYGANGVEALATYNTGAPGTWTATSNVKMTAAQTLGASNITINSLNLSDTAGARTLTMNSRTVTIDSGGILSSGNNHVIGLANATAGALRSNTGELIVTVQGTGSRSLTIRSQIQDIPGTPMTLIKSGGGKLNILPNATNNTHTGGTIVNEGSIEISNIAALGSTSTSVNFLNLNGGSLELSAASNITITASGARQVTIGRAGGRIELDVGETLTIDNGVPLTGPGQLTVGGADATGGILNLDGVVSVQGGLSIAAGTVNLNNTGNTFSGGVTMSGGTLVIPTGAELPANTGLTMTGGTVRLESGTTTLNFLSGSLNNITTIENPLTSAIDATLVVNQEANSTYGGQMRDSNASLHFQKQGTGILTLSNGDSNYTGITTIAGGTLAVTKLNIIAADSSLGWGAPTVFFDTADRLLINSGASLSFVGSAPSFTDRSFTMGTGSDGAAIYANGTALGATVVFQEYVGEQVKFDNTGAATLTLGGRNAGNNIFGLKLADNGGDYLSVVKTGSGTWILDNLNGSNSYSGSTTIYEGTLVITGDGALGAKGLGGAPVSVVGGVLDLKNVNYTSSLGQTENVLLAGGRLDTSLGTSAWAGRVGLMVSSTVNVGRGASLDLQGTVFGSGGLNKDGFGRLVLSGNNALDGATRILDGEILLDYTTNSGDKLADSSALFFGGGRTGGTLIVKGNGTDESVASTTLDRGEHRVVRDDTGTIKVRLGVITRNTGSLLDIEENNLATTVSNNNSTGILGSWLTVGNTSWGFKDGANNAEGIIRPLSSYVVNSWLNANSNTDAVSDFSPSSGATTNTLRFNQATTPVTVTLSGNNTLNSGGILVTPNVTVSNQIKGGTLTAGAASGNELVVQQFSTQAGFSIESVVRNAGATVVGLQKLGPGTLVLSGANTYTGVTTVGGGVLAVNNLANGGLPSGLGQSTRALGNVLLGGGTLDYFGESTTTDRGMTVREFGALSVNDEDAILTITGSATVADVGRIDGGSTGFFEKSGTGTLRLLRLEASGGLTAMQQVDVQNGKLLLEYGYSTLPPSTGTAPIPPNAIDRIVNSNASLRMSGGKLELIGEDFVNDNPGDGNDGNGQSFQRFFGQFTIGQGASEVQVTSRTSLNTTPGFEQITNLGIGDANNRLDIIRDLGGTVLFVENPNGGRANLILSTLGEYEGTILPWATYWDKSDLSQPGVNNFAAIEQSDDGLVSADSKSLHILKSNPADWTNNGSEDISEEGSVAFGGSNITTDARIRTLRFFNDNDSGTLTIDGTNTMTLTAGAVLVAYNVRNQVKTITGGNLTSEYLTGNGAAELILHNYNTSTPFRLESAIIDPSGLVTPTSLNFIHTGTGTTSLFAANTYTGKTVVTGGVVKLENANAVPGGIGTGGTSQIILDGGVIGLTAGSGDFTRSLGTGANQLLWNGTGGFAAYGADQNVNLGGSVTPSLVRWGAGGFVPSGDTLVIGAWDADKTLTFKNSIDLGVIDRLVRVENGSATEDAVLSGNLTGSAALVKSGEGGLRISGINTHLGGVGLAEGTLFVPNPTALGSGTLNVGVTENTTTKDAPTLVLESGTISNAVVIGNKNSAGITSIEVPSNNVTVTGTVQLSKSGVFVGPESGQTLSLTGNISGTGGFTVVNGGKVILAGNNSHATVGAGSGTAIDGATIVRHGTIELKSNSALGDPTKAVELGDKMITPIMVDRATTGSSLILAQGTFDPLGNGSPGSVTGLGAYYGVSNTLDGGTYTVSDVGKRILVKDEIENPERNGVYTIVSVNTTTGTMNLTRVDDGGFPLAPLHIAYGTGVSVQNGTLNGGSNLFLAAKVDAADINSDPFYWKRESSLNPDVALRIGGPLSTAIANPIDINATNGTGTTTIGGGVDFKEGSAELSGPITLQSQNVAVETKDLILSAEDCAKLIISGSITESDVSDVLGLIKTGTGTVELKAANTYKGSTEVQAGVLQIGHATALGSGNLEISGGIVGLTAASGDFTRTLGVGAGQIQWTDSGGFAAYGTADRTVNIGASVTWGSGSFVPTGNALVLGARDATAKVVVSSSVDLGATQRTVNVVNGPVAVEAELSGSISGTGSGALVKTGYGTLLLSGSNSYAATTGTSIQQGTLQGKRLASGSVFGTSDIAIGGTATQGGDALKLELLGDNVSNTTFVMTNNVAVGSQNATGTTSIDVTNGTAVTSVPEVDLQGTLSLARGIFLGPDTDSILRISGAVSGVGGITVTDGGTVSLTNSSNSYGTSGGVAGVAIDGGTIIRDGTIQVGASTALGTTLVELGDAKSHIAIVDRASNGMSLSQCGAVFTGGTFTEVGVDFAGATYVTGDIGKRLLIKDELSNPERNGVYAITAVSGGRMTLVRVTDFDATTEMKYGSTVEVTNGPVPNQKYFLTGNVGTVNTSPILWREAAANPNVALLASTAVTIANNIDLNSAGSSGTTTIGSISSLNAGTPIFSGNISMQSQLPSLENLTLDISSSTISSTATGVLFSGVISDGPDSLQIRKSGVGVATLSGDNLYDGGTLVNAGVLLVNNTGGSGTGSGTVNVTGAGTVLGGTGTIAGLTVIGADALLQPGMGVVDGNSVFDSSAGTLALTGGLTMNADSAMVLQLNGQTPGTQFDRLVVSGGNLTIDINAMIQIMLGYSPSMGQSFDVLDWTTLVYSGTDLADQLSFVDSPLTAWDTSNFHATGILVYIAPEPGRIALFMFASLLAILRRRR